MLTTIPLRLDPQSADSVPPWQPARRSDIDIEPPVPEGFLRWGRRSPPPGLWIKAVLAASSGYAIVRGEAQDIVHRHPGQRPFAWQRAPRGRVLSPGWNAFPDVLPPPRQPCCVMYFDLQGELGDSAGFGVYLDGWPFGGFSERSAYPEEPKPEDAARWAAFAWRSTQSDERSHAAIASALSQAAGSGSLSGMLRALA